MLKVMLTYLSVDEGFSLFGFLKFDSCESPPFTSFTFHVLRYSALWSSCLLLSCSLRQAPNIFTWDPTVHLHSTAVVVRKLRRPTESNAWNRSWRMRKGKHLSLRARTKWKFFKIWWARSQRLYPLPGERSLNGLTHTATNLNLSAQWIECEAVSNANMVMLLLS